MRLIGRRVKIQWGMGPPHSNQAKPRRLSTPKSSAFAGVSLNRATGKWYAYITCNGRMRSLGYYIDEEEAARVYDAEARAVRLIDILTYLQGS